MTIGNAMFSQIIEKHYRENFNTLVKRYKRSLGSEQLSEDVVQEAYARCLKYQHTWDPRQDFAPWFSIILRNAFRDQLNSERGIVFEEIDEFDYRIEDKTRINELRDAVELYIARESLAHQPVLTLFLLGGYTGKEVSEITEYTQTNVRAIVANFKKKFLLRFKE